MQEIPGLTDYTCRQNLGAGQENLYPRDILQMQLPPLQKSDLPVNSVRTPVPGMPFHNVCQLWQTQKLPGARTHLTAFRCPESFTHYVYCCAGWRWKDLHGLHKLMRSGQQDSRCAYLLILGYALLRR